MKKRNSLVCFLIALSFILMMACASEPEKRTYSTTPTEKSDITFLLTNFDILNNTNAETYFNTITGKGGDPGGYIYTYHDPTSPTANIHPWPEQDERCLYCDPSVNDGGDKGACCHQDRANRGYCEMGGFDLKPKNCMISSGFKVNSKNPFNALDSEYSLNIKGTSSGNGVGWGIYFLDDYTEPRVEGAKEARKLATKGQEGLVFWATGNATIQVVLSMPELAPLDDGGVCNPDVGEKCYDYHSAQFELDGKWREYYAKWSDFKQEGWGIPVVFDPDRFINIQFKIPSDAGETDFDLWFDHVGFFGGEMWEFTEYLNNLDDEDLGDD